MNRHSVLYILPVTQDVKLSGTGSRLETHQAVHYNLRVSNARISGHFVLVIACAPLLVAGACEKKTKPNDTGAVAALDNAAAPAAAENPADTTPLSGIDVSNLEGDIRAWQPALWVTGHTHFSHDDVIDGTSRPLKKSKVWR